MDNHSIATEALSSYAVQSPIIEFIRHNENLTYKITDGVSGLSYLLRIHKPVHDELHGLQHSEAGLNGEMQLLQALGENSTLNVQEPVRNREGEFVTRVACGDTYIQCTVLQWLEGRDSQLDDFSSRDAVLQYGQQVGMLHRYTSGYASELTCDRPAYASIDENRAMLERLKFGREHGIFTSADYDTVSEAFAMINSRLQTYERSPDTWGIIHADINRGNVIVTERGFTIIDYCLYGQGYFLYDGAAGALSVPSRARDDFMEGYASEYSAPRSGTLELLEGFMLLHILGYYSFHMMNSAVHPKMRERMPVFCQNTLTPFLKERPIFYEL
ncbi:phosphotransferase [Paenibacillus sp. MER TA 81-3]|uniref:phosphotransferase enzyme family protein n=1 Tax=Paenibacillus sp. MER TA 81-3 TaxID=2939573 RepID=UPI00203F5BAA|nr:phosphotransferase [Paenibacillus sp. MER TA 81-3]MCM3342177.1 phosphotransferase [Paenibacillus sp. MER TA 81-3]